jgi:hypothetical protein
MLAERECDWCGMRFQPENPEQAFCGKTHRVKAYRARRKASGWVKPQKTDCPHPSKVAFHDFDSALRKLVILNRSDLEVYPCRCGKHHIGHILPYRIRQAAVLISSYEGAMA